MNTRILTVDDSRTMLELLGATLRGAGYEVIQAENGQQGLDMLDANEVDLIITDINMPIMDGITFIKRLRAEAAHSATPILILTTESSNDKKAQGREAGATGWVVKPFDPGKLLDVIRRVTH